MAFARAAARAHRHKQIIINASNIIETAAWRRVAPSVRHRIGKMTA